jgi:hypothetical protein
MKKQFFYVKTLLFVAVLTAALSSCKKQTVEVPAESPSPTNATNLTITITRYNDKTGECYSGNGICIIIQPNRNIWADYALQTDEAKGEAWATDLGGDSSTVRLYLPKSKLSQTEFNRLTVQKRMLFENDTYLPKALIEKVYKAAGIKNIPAEIRIPSGAYPVVVEGNPTATNLTIHIQVKVKEVNGKTIIEVRIWTTEP